MHPQTSRTHPNSFLQWQIHPDHSADPSRPPPQHPESNLPADTEERSSLSHREMLSLASNDTLLVK